MEGLDQNLQGQLGKVGPEFEKSTRNSWDKVGHVNLGKLDHLGTLNHGLLRRLRKVELRFDKSARKSWT